MKREPKKRKKNLSIWQFPERKKVPFQILSPHQMMARVWD
jgi:hypothetical protein